MGGVRPPQGWSGLTTTGLTTTCGLLRDLATAKGPEAAPRLRKSVSFAWGNRWRGMISVATRNALAATLVDDAPRMSHAYMMFGPEGRDGEQSSEQAASEGWTKWGCALSVAHRHSCSLPNHQLSKRNFQRGPPSEPPQGKNWIPDSSPLLSEMSVHHLRGHPWKVGRVLWAPPRYPPWPPKS